MDFTALPSLSGEALTAALALDFTALDNEALTAALTERKGHAATLFAMETPSIAEVNVAEAVVASIVAIEGEQATRAAAVQDAADRFAAARATFSAEDDTEVEASADTEVEAVVEGDTEQDAEDGDESDDTTDEAADEAADEGDAEGEAVTTASGTDHTRNQKVPASAAKAVGRKTKRPAVKSSAEVTITAGADISGFSTGQQMSDMEQVTKALINRTKGFAPFNAQAAAAARSQSGGAPVLSKFGVATFGISRPESMVASSTDKDFNSVREAIRVHEQGIQSAFAQGKTMTAAAWCAPSENIYSYIADYVVDGLVTVPEVGAPRGGLNITTGPRVGGESQGGTNLDGFGFVQTEAEAEARTLKTLETIECPDFVDHRLDAIGYGYTIPILTQKAYPEIVTDALRFANVMYAHKVNRRIINDMVALSSAVTFEGYGPSLTDSLEVLSLVAVKERRKWNIGVNATMEVKVPEFAREIYRADMSRRAGLALDDVATDQKIEAHFAARKLNVEYVSDWQELTGANVVLPGTFDVLIYPSGTFIKAVEDVVNLSAIYDAASLTVNEYTGVFFEQGIFVAKAGYGSSKVTLPINTAGEAGALTLTGYGDATENGSF